MTTPTLEIIPAQTDARTPVAHVSRPRAALLMGLYLGTLVLPLALSAMGHPVPAGQFIKSLALGFGLVGLMIIATSFILAARYRWIADPFGLDAVMLFHRRMAVVGYCSILVHLALLSYLNTNLLTRLWLPWHLQLGRIAILLLTTQIIVSLYRAALRVEFEFWRIIHRFLGLVVLLIAFVHGLLSSGGFAPWPLRIVVLAVVAAALWSWAWSRLFRPEQLKQYRYRIQDVYQMSRGLWRIKLAPVNAGRALRYSPGQFAYFNFHRSGAGSPGEEHVWTIASSPSEPDGLMLAVKELGDFTRTMGQSKSGDIVTVHGPFGRFSHRLHPSADELVFIAAGIGITPFRSMIRWITDHAENRRVLLLNANKSRGDIAFHRELAECQNRADGTVRVVHVLSRPDPDWTGEHGHINAAMIKKYCDADLTGKTFWICGPGAFTAAIIKSLRTAGVPADKIHTEAFCLAHAPVQPDGRGRRLNAFSAVAAMAALLMVLLFALIRTDFLTARGGGPHHSAAAANRAAHHFAGSGRRAN